MASTCTCFPRLWCREVGDNSIVADTHTWATVCLGSRTKDAGQVRSIVLDFSRGFSDPVPSVSEFVITFVLQMEGYHPLVAYWSFNTRPLPLNPSSLASPELDFEDRRTPFLSLFRFETKSHRVKGLAIHPKR